MYISTMEDFKAYTKQFYEGEVNAEQHKAAYQSMVGNKVLLTAQLNGYTVKQLKEKFPRWFGYSGERKANIIKSIIDDRLSWFAIGGYSYAMHAGSMEQARADKVNSLTDEDITEAVKKHQAEVEKTKKAIENPQTYEEFREFIAYRGEKALTPELRERLDAIIAERNHEQQAREAERKKTVDAALEAGDVEFTIKEITHTKRNCPCWVVRLGERVDRELYNTLNRKAKQLGGYYSRFGPVENRGFLFFDKENAEKFSKINQESADRSKYLEQRETAKTERTAKRLKDTAERIQDRAEDSLNQDRKTNTVKRAREASHAEASAREAIGIAKTLERIADALQAGEIKFLKFIKHKTHIETLESQLYSAKMKANQAQPDRWHYPETQSRPVTLEDIDYLKKYPHPWVRTADLLSLIHEVCGMKGGSMAANRLLKFIKRHRKGKDDSPILYINEQQTIDVQRMEGLGKRKGLADYKTDLIQGLDTFNRLQTMAIGDLPTLRAALREYMQYRGDAPKADPIKEAERALVGNTFDGADFFPTPPGLAQLVIAQVDIEPGERVLEPSAGAGALCDAVRDAQPDAVIHCVEQNSQLRELLRLKDYEIVDHNFMEFSPAEQYDKIVMNPPFSKAQDAEHIQRAYTLLKPGGRMVAICSEGLFFRSTSKEQTFRDWLETLDHTAEKLPDGSFNAPDAMRSTGVACRLVVIDKELEAEQPEPAPVEVYRAGNEQAQAFEVEPSLSCAGVFPPVQTNAFEPVQCNLF